MRETLHQFGMGENICGTHLGAENRDFCVVMSNVGLNHRVGPSRAWVEVARALGKAGISSFRFDASGLGDSLPRSESIGDIERMVLDLEEVHIFLKAMGYSKIVLLSNCSGTDPNHRFLKTSPKNFVGAVFIDGYCYETPGHLAQRKKGALEWRRWRRRIAQMAPEFAGYGAAQAFGQADEIFVRDYPEISVLEADLLSFRDRQLSMLFIFSGQTMYNYDAQFYETFDTQDWQGCVEVVYWPQANHTFSYSKDRQKLVEKIVSWSVELSRKA